jgi:flagellar biosynthetic protein FlhB
MDNEQDQSSKTEEPTSRRLEKAREDGQILRSQDFSVAVILITVAVSFWFFGGYFVDLLTRAFRYNLTFDSRVTDNSREMVQRLAGTVEIVSPGLILVMAVTVLGAILAATVFGGIGFTWKAIEPKLNKLSIVSGLKRMFGLRSLFELGKSLLKTALIALAIALTMAFFIERLASLSVLPFGPSLLSSGQIILVGSITISVSLILIALVDMPFQLYQHRSKLRMSKQEIKDELKDSEGRPEVRQRIRQRQREVAMGQMMAAIEKADVVITNPSHFAVALSYSPGSSVAPKLVAKGVNEIALSIRNRAEFHGVPVFEAPMLARALFFTTPLDGLIPESLYHTVAEVIAYIFNLNTFQQRNRTIRKPDPRVPREMLFDTDGNPLYAQES